MDTTQTHDHTTMGASNAMSSSPFLGAYDKRKAGATCAISGTPSMRELLAGSKRRRILDIDATNKSRTVRVVVGRPPVTASTPSYADLYGDESSCPQTPSPGPDLSLSIAASAEGLDPPMPPRRPRYMRRCSVTKFSLERTARLAVNQIEQGNDGYSLGFDPLVVGRPGIHTIRRTGGFAYRDIAPILDKAMEQISSNCY